MSCLAANRSRNWHSLLALAGVVCVMWGCENSRVVQVKFETAEGLEIGDPVHLDSSLVGEVQEIKIQSRSPIITVSYTANYQPCKTDTFEVEAIGLVGQRRLRIHQPLACVAAGAGDYLIGKNQIELSQSQKDIIRIAKGLKTRADSILSVQRAKRDSLDDGTSWFRLE